MSQTWVIKDNAPVDEDSYILNKIDISFTSGGEKFVGIEMYDEGITYIALKYYRSNGTLIEAATMNYEYNETQYYWLPNYEKYKTLVFDTDPTGELLVWLQKNADEQSDQEYLTRKSELTSVANAIRAKGGTSAPLVYPDGFVTAIQAIQTGTELQIIVTVTSGATVTATKGSLSVSGTAINGTCTLTVPEAGTWSVTATLNGQTSNTENVTFTDSYVMSFSLVSAVLNDNDWATIKEVSDKGEGANYWSIGDCKAVAVHGTVGTWAVNGTYYVYIIGFNHNSSKEGNGITFGTFKTALSGGKDICLVDGKSGAESTKGTKYFNMNHSSSTNSGGWKGCDLRYDVLGSTNTNDGDATATTATNPVANTLMAALPSDLRAVMKPMTIYTDNTGGGNNASYVTKTTDYLPLLAEYEIFGTRQSANSAEKNYQAQYAYYSAGNSKVKYRHSATGSTAWWWERSPLYGSNTFCSVSTNGNADINGAGSSGGVAPIFRV